MIELIVLAVVFLAVFGLIVAIAAAVRDVSSRRFNMADRRLSLAADSSQIDAYYSQQDVHSGRLNKWFYDLVNQSSVNFDAPTAIWLILGCGVVVAALFFVIWENLLAVAGGGLLGILLPIVWLSFQSWRRMRAIREILPEALQIVGDSVRAGHSLEQSAEMVATELRDPLSTEFAQCASQLKLGNSPTAVMEKMSQRIPLPEFRIFATAVMVHQTAGGNLALLAERLSHSARERQEFTGHVNAVTAGSRLSALGMVFASVFAISALAWLEPEYLRAFVNHPLGPTLLAVAVGLLLIGILWVWRLIRVGY